MLFLDFLMVAVDHLFELGVADVDNADEILFPYLTDKITFVYFLKRYLPQKTSWFSLS